MAGTISFSGLTSGLDTSSWIEALVSVKQNTITDLQSQAEIKKSLLNVVNSIKSFFTSFQTCLQQITDSQFGAGTMDIFAKNLALSSNANIATATATFEAARQSYDVLVEKLATETKVTSGRYETATRFATLDTKLGLLGGKDGNITVNSQSFSVSKDDTIGDLIKKFANVGVVASFDTNKSKFTIGYSTGEINFGTTELDTALNLRNTSVGGLTSGAIVYATRDTQMSKLGLTAGDIFINDNSYTINKSGDTYKIKNNTDNSETDISELGNLLDFLAGTKANAVATVGDQGKITLDGVVLKSVDGGTNLMDVLNLNEVINNTVFESGALTVTNNHIADLTTTLGQLGINGDKTIVVDGASTTLTNVQNYSLQDIKDRLAMLDPNMSLEIDENGVITLATNDHRISGTLIDELGLTVSDTGTELVSEAKIVTYDADKNTLLSKIGVTDAMGYTAYSADGTQVATGTGLSGKTIDEFMTMLQTAGLNAHFDESTSQIIIDNGYIEGDVATILGMTSTTEDIEIIATGDTKLSDLGATSGKTLSINGGGETNFGVNTTLQTIMDAVVAAGGTAELVDGNISFEGVTLSGTLLDFLGLTAMGQGTTIKSGVLEFVDTSESTSSGTVIETTSTNLSTSTKLSELGITGNKTLSINGGASTTYANTKTLQDIKSAIEGAGGTMTIDSTNNTISIEGVGLTGTLVEALGFTQTDSHTKITSSSAITYGGDEKTITGSNTLADLGATANTTLVFTAIDGTTTTRTFAKTATVDTVLSAINGIQANSASMTDGIISVDLDGYTLSGTAMPFLNLESTGNATSAYVAAATVITGNTSTSSGVVSSTNATNLSTSTKLSELGITGNKTLSINGGTSTTYANTKTLQDIKSAIEGAGGTMTIDSTNNTISIEGVGLSGTLVDALGFTQTDSHTKITSSSAITYGGDEKTITGSNTLADLGATANTTLVFTAIDGTTTTRTFAKTATVDTVLSAINGIQENSASMTDGLISIDLDGYTLSGSAMPYLNLESNGNATTAYQSAATIVTTGNTSTSSGAVSSTNATNLSTSTKLSELGIASGKTLSINGGTAVSYANTKTLQDIKSAIETAGGTMTIDSANNTISIEGVGLSGTLVDALGFTQTDSHTKITSTSAITYGGDEKTITGSNTLEDLGATGNTTLLFTPLNGATTTKTFAKTATIQTVLDTINSIQANSASMTDGIISVDLDGYSMSGTAMSFLNLESTGSSSVTGQSAIVTVITGNTSTSSSAVSSTNSTNLSTSTKLSELGITGNKTLSINGGTSTTYANTKTLQDIKSAIEGAGGTMTIDSTNNTISIEGVGLTGTLVDALGLTQSDTHTKITSGSAITYGGDEKTVTGSNTLADLGATSNTTLVFTDVEGNATTKTFAKTATIQTVLDTINGMQANSASMTDGIISLNLDGYYLSGTAMSYLNLESTGNSTIAYQSSVTTVTTGNTAVSGSALNQTTASVLSMSTKLSQLGLTGSYTFQADFDELTDYHDSWSGETVTFTGNSTLQDIENYLTNEYGIAEIVINADNTLTFNNVSGVSGTLATALGITETEHTWAVTSEDAVTVGGLSVNITEDTTISQIGGSSGVYSLLYRDGTTANTFSYSGTTTVGEVLQNLRNAGLDATLSDGIVTITNTAEKTLSAGSLGTLLKLGATGSNYRYASTITSYVGTTTYTSSASLASRTETATLDSTIGDITGRTSGTFTYYDNRDGDNHTYGVNSTLREIQEDVVSHGGTFTVTNGVINVTFADTLASDNTSASNVFKVLGLTQTKGNAYIRYEDVVCEVNDMIYTDVEMVSSVGKKYEIYNSAGAMVASGTITSGMTWGDWVNSVNSQIGSNAVSVTYGTINLGSYKLTGSMADVYGIDYDITYGYNAPSLFYKYGPSNLGGYTTTTFNFIKNFNESNYLVDGGASLSECDSVSDVSQFKSGEIYTINSGQDYANFLNKVNSGYNTSGVTFVLTTDIDLASNSTINNFRGTFDGNGYLIGGFTSTMFGTLSGTVKNLVIAGASISTSSQSAGIVANTMEGGTIDNVVVVNSSIRQTSQGYHVGGLVGKTSYGYTNVISNTYLDNVSISSVANSVAHGGLVGDAYDLAISNSYITDVNFDPSGSSGHIGGLLGYACDVTINNSFVDESCNLGQDNPDYTDGYTIHGLIGGDESSSITNTACYVDNISVSYGTPTLSTASCGAIRYVDWDENLYDAVVDWGVLDSDDCCVKVTIGGTQHTWQLNTTTNNSFDDLIDWMDSLGLTVEKSNTDMVITCDSKFTIDKFFDSVDVTPANIVTNTIPDEDIFESGQISIDSAMTVQDFSDYFGNGGAVTLTYRDINGNVYNDTLDSSMTLDDAIYDISMHNDIGVYDGRVLFDTEYYYDFGGTFMEFLEEFLYDDSSQILEYSSGSAVQYTQNVSLTMNTKLSELGVEDQVIYIHDSYGNEVGSWMIDASEMGVTELGMAIGTMMMDTTYGQEGNSYDVSVADGKITINLDGAYTLSSNGNLMSMLKMTGTPTTSYESISKDTRLNQVRSNGATDYSLTVTLGDGTSHTINLEGSNTYDDLDNELNQYGIYLTYSGNKVYANSVSGTFSLSGNIATFAGWTSGAAHTDKNTSQSTSAVKYTTASSTLSNSTTIKELLNQDSAYLNYTIDGGAQKSLSFTGTDTVATIIEKLALVGIDATVDSGYFVASSNKSFTLTGDLAEAILGDDVEWNNWTSKSVSNTLSPTSTTSATNSSVLADLGINSGTIFVKDGNGNLVNTINVDNSLTVAQLSSALGAYGMSVNIDNSTHKATISSNSANYLVDGTSNVLSKLAITSWTPGTTNMSDATTMAQLGFTSGTTLNVIVGGVNQALTFGANDTIATMRSALEALSIDSFYSSGCLVTASTSKLYSFSGELADKLGFTYDNTGASSNFVSDETLTYTTSTGNITAGTTIGELLHSDSGGTLKYTLDGGSVQEISYSASDTIQDVIDDLASQGITATISSGVFTAQGDCEFTLAGSVGNALKGASSTTTTRGNGYESGDLTYDTSSNLTNSSTLESLGINSGEIYLVNRTTGQVSGTINVDSSWTMSQLASGLAVHGITLDVNSSTGKVTVTSNDADYLQDGSSNLVSALKLTSWNATQANMTDATTMAQLGFTSGTTLDVVVDGQAHSLTFGANDTIANMRNTLDSLGIESFYDAGILVLGSTSKTFTLSGELANKLGFENYTTRSSSNYESDETLTYTTATGNISASTTIGELLHNDSGGTLKYTLDGGSVQEISYSASDTIQDVIDDLGSQGITATVSSGVFTAQGDCEFTLAGSVGNALKGASATTTTRGNGYESGDLTYDTTSNINDNSTLESLGINSGHIYIVNGTTGNITETVNIDSSWTMSQLASGLAVHGITLDVDSTTGKVTATSNDADFLQDGTSNLVTGLKLNSWNSTNVAMTDATTMAQLGFTSGTTLNVVVDGVNQSLTFSANNTFGDVRSSLESLGITVEFADVTSGALRLTSTSKTFSLSGDLATKLALNYSTNDSSTYASDETLTYTTATGNITESTTIGELLHNDTGGTLKYTIDGGEVQTITYSASDTVQDVIDDLATQGITATVSSGVFTAEGDCDFALIGAVGNALKGASATTSTRGNGYESGDLTYDTTTNINNNSTLESLGINSGNIYIINETTGEITETIDVDSSWTMSQLASVLSPHGIGLNVNSSTGKVTVTSNDADFLQDGTSNLVSGLKLTSWTSTDVAMDDSTTMAQLGFTSGTTLDAVVDGETHTLTFGANATLENVRGSLESLGITSSWSSGNLSLESTSKTFSFSGDLANKLGFTYTTNSSSNYESDETLTFTTDTGNITATTTIGELLHNDTGGTLKYTLDNGSVQEISYSASDTIQDVIDDLATQGITATVSSGVFSAEGDCDFTLTGAVGNALKGASPTTAIRGNGYVSGDLTYDSTANIDNDSTLESIGINSGTMYLTNDETGIKETINVDNTWTIGQLASVLSPYGVTLNVDSATGKVTALSNDADYLKDGSSNVVSKLKLATWNETEETVSATTTLADLGFENGASLNILVDGVTPYSLQFGATESLQSVMDSLAALDIHASISGGQFEATSTTHSFVMSGDLANFLTSGSANGYITENKTYVTANTLIDPGTYTTAQSHTITHSHNLGLNDTIESMGFADGATLRLTLNGDAQHTLNFNADDTLQDVFDALSVLGIGGTVDTNGIIYLDSNTETYSLGGNLGAYINQNSASINLDSEMVSTPLSYDTVDNINYDTKLSEMGVDVGYINLIKDGELLSDTIGIEETTTIGQLKSALDVYGIDCTIEEDATGGSYIKLHSEGETYVLDGTSNLVAQTVLQKQEQGDYVGYVSYWDDDASNTQTGLLTEDMLLSDFDKDTDGDGTIDQTAVGSLIFDLGRGDDAVEHIINISADDTIGSFLQKLKDEGVNAVLEDGRIRIDNSVDGIEFKTAAGTSNVLSTLGLTEDGALDTYATSNAALTYEEDIVTSVAGFADADTLLSTVNVTDGAMSIYVDGKKCTVEVLSTDTFETLFGKIVAACGAKGVTVKAGFLDVDGNIVQDPTAAKNTGIVAIEAVGDHKLMFGASNDKSNFATIANLKQESDTLISGSRPLYKVNLNSVLTTAGLFKEGQVTTGSFTIGDATITIGANTTLNDVITQINKAEKSYASAYWDTLSGTLVIQSTETGESLVNIDAGDTNFTQILGLTNADGSLVTSAQTLGSNAIVKINGSTVTSTTNNIDESVSRIKGLTINLKGVSNGETVTITVEQDKENICDAVSDIVDSYNVLMENIEKELGEEGAFANDTMFRLMRNNLKKLMTKTVNNSLPFKNLAAIGISTGEAQNSISTDVTALIMDRDKLLEALDKDSDGVRQLLVGTRGGSEGVFLQALDIVDKSLKSSGYLSSTENSLNKDIKKINKKVTTLTEQLARYRTQLENKFNSMDRTISALQTSYSTFLN